MVRQDPLPDWIKQDRPALRKAYKQLAATISQRCDQIIKSSRRNEDGKLCDDLGTLSDYRGDATYCLGVAGRLLTEEAEQAAAAKERKGWTKEQPWAPQALQEAKAAKKREERPPAPMPEPEDAIRAFRVKEYMRHFTQREAEALILTTSLLMSDEEAAVVMGISVQTVKNILQQARTRRKAAAVRGEIAG